MLHIMMTVTQMYGGSYQVNVSDDDSGPSQLPSVDRPRRQRRPNVRYSDQEYDLSAVATPKKSIQLLGLYISKKRPNT